MIKRGWQDNDFSLLKNVDPFYMARKIYVNFFYVVRCKSSRNPRIQIIDLIFDTKQKDMHNTLKHLL